VGRRTTGQHAAPAVLQPGASEVRYLSWPGSGKKKGIAAVCGYPLDSGGASRIRTADLWIMIPSL
jgi:hypothetical protein